MIRCGNGDWCYRMNRLNRFVIDHGNKQLSATHVLKGVVDHRINIGLSEPDREWSNSVFLFPGEAIELGAELIRLGLYAEKLKDSTF